MAKVIGIGKRLVVKPFEENGNETSFGIVLPEKKGDGMPQRGTIVSFGEDAKKFGLKEGDEILFREYSPTSIEIDGEKVLLLDIDDVLGKIEK
ncbi:co-chaperone GroES [Candidatus Gracilibacteria bacterium]|nr:co-chaperone GroES [Candidatus Gracilibacteria bacterium]